MGYPVFRYRITFIEEILGTWPSDKEIHTNYIGSKAPDAATLADEIEELGTAEVEEKGTTVFPRNREGQCILKAYQIKGMLKNAQKMINQRSQTNRSKQYVSAYKGKMDNYVFIKATDQDWGEADHGIILNIPVDNDGFLVDCPDCQRPLRAETAQGPRVALAHSETCCAGTWCEFDIKIIAPNQIPEENVTEWMALGKYYGLGQWRNSGKGRFKAELLDRWEEEL